MSENGSYMIYQDIFYETVEYVGKNVHSVQVSSLL